MNDQANLFNRKNLIIVANLKGGVGKSMVTQFIYLSAADLFEEENVVLVDLDADVRTSSKLFKDKALSLNVKIEDHLVTLSGLGERNQDKTIIVDFPAGNTKSLNSILGGTIVDFIENYTEFGFNVKVVIPVTNEEDNLQGLPKLFADFPNNVQFFLVKNLKSEMDELKYSKAFGLFNENFPNVNKAAFPDGYVAETFAREVMGIDTNTEKIINVNGQDAFEGYTKNCVLMPMLPDQIKEEVGSNPLSDEVVRNIKPFVIRKSASKFASKMISRFQRTDLFK